MKKNKNLTRENIKKNPYKACQILCKKFSPPEKKFHLIKKNAENLKVKKIILDQIEVVLLGRVKIDKLDRETVFLISSTLFKIKEKISELSKKESDFKNDSSFRVLYGGGNFFDGTERKPVNKLSSKGIRRR